MGEIRLYKTTEKTVTELNGSSISMEKSLQSFIESHLNELLGIRFLKSEHSTGKIHGGRIDTLVSIGKEIQSLSNTNDR